MRLGAGIFLGMPQFANAAIDPLAGIVFDGRWQMRSGLDSYDPFGVFQDGSCTVPAASMFDPIGGWKDLKSGNGLIITQPDTDKQPLLFLDGSVPAGMYDGMDDLMIVPPELIADATELSVFVGFYHDTSPPESSNASGVVDNWGSDPSTEDHAPWSGGPFYHGWGATSRKNNISYSEDLTAPSVLTITSQANDWKLRLNGTQYATDASSTVGIGANPLIGGNNGLFPGGGTASIMTNMLGKIFALFVMRRVETSENIELIESYIAGLAV